MLLLFSAIMYQSNLARDKIESDCGYTTLTAPLLDQRNVDYTIQNKSTPNSSESLFLEIFH